MASKSSTPVTDMWRDVQAPPAPPIRPVTVRPGKTAFLLLDFLRDVCTPKRPRAEAALPVLQSFLEQARRRKLLVVHTTTRKGLEDGSDLADPIRPIAGERVFRAPFNKFHGTELAAHLKQHGVDTLIIAGTSPNSCLMFTAGGAVLNGFSVIVPIDGMPAENVYQEQFVAWELVNASGFVDTTTLSKFDLISFAD